MIMAYRHIDNISSLSKWRFQWHKEDLFVDPEKKIQIKVHDYHPGKVILT